MFMVVIDCQLVPYRKWVCMDNMALQSEKFNALRVPTNFLRKNYRIIGPIFLDVTKFRTKN